MEIELPVQGCRAENAIQCDSWKNCLFLVRIIILGPGMTGIAVAVAGLQGCDRRRRGGQFTGAVEQGRLHKGGGTSPAGDGGPAAQGPRTNGGKEVALHLQHDDEIL